MPKKDLEALGAQYRDALNAVGPHRRRLADAELRRLEWLKRHRGVPAQLIYDSQTGDPTDPELVALDAGVAKARADVEWCRAVVVAAGELYKGESFAVVVARNEAHRPAASKSRNHAMQIIGAT